MTEGPDFMENTTHAPAEAYPPRPVAEERPGKHQTLKFTISILLFGAIYYFFVSRNIEIIIWLVIIVLIHELGHYFAMKIFKYQDLTIFFIPLVGAVAGGSKETVSQKEKAIVLLAGPVPGIVIGLALYGAGLYFNNYSCLRLSYAFVLVNALNLLPVYPLDGGQLLRTLFLESRQLLTNVFIIASIILLAAYAIAQQEWFLLVVAYFLVTRMIGQRQLHKVRQELENRKIDFHKPYSALTDAEYWQIREVVIAEYRELGRKIFTTSYIVSDNEKQVISFIRSVVKPKPLRDLSATGIVIFLFTWIAAIAVPLLVMTRIGRGLLG
jgi:Zn-dependent protease